MRIPMLSAFRSNLRSTLALTFPLTVLRSPVEPTRLLGKVLEARTAERESLGNPSHVFHLLFSGKT